MLPFQVSTRYRHWRMNGIQLASGKLGDTSQCARHCMQILTLYVQDEKRNPQAVHQSFRLWQILSPYAKLLLQESKRNSLKDFVHVAGPLGVTHFLLLSTTKTAPYFRVAKTPRGPTLTFQIKQYSLAGDIAAASPKYRAPLTLFQDPPLVRQSQLKLPYLFKRTLYQKGTGQWLERIYGLRRGRLLRIWPVSCISPSSLVACRLTFQIVLVQNASFTPDGHRD